VLSGRVEADDAYLGGVSHSGKPGRGAGRKRPFLAAVLTGSDGTPTCLSLQALNQVRAEAILRWGRAHLHPAAEVVTDGWSAYQILGTNGWSHRVKKTSRIGWRRAKHPAFKWVNTVLGNLKANLLGVCRAISLKHLPRYLAEFQYRFNRRFDLSTILPRLLRAASLTPPMPYRLVKLAEVEG
jgi:hypothetical protein